MFSYLFQSRLKPIISQQYNVHGLFDRESILNRINLTILIPTLRPTQSTTIVVMLLQYCKFSITSWATNNIKSYLHGSTKNLVYAVNIVDYDLFYCFTMPYLIEACVDFVLTIKNYSRLFKQNTNDRVLVVKIANVKPSLHTFRRTFKIIII